MAPPIWLVVPQPGQAPVPSGPDAVQHGIATGQLDPAAPVSIDGGRSWSPAAQAVSRHRIGGQNDAIMGYVAPGRVEPSSLIAGYLALFSLLFFGGPLAVGAAAIGWDDGKATIGVRLAFVAAAAALGPLPIVLLCRSARRKLQEDPTLDGRGRMVFALVVAALMALPIAAGLVGAIVRAITG